LEAGLQTLIETNEAIRSVPLQDQSSCSLPTIVAGYAGLQEGQSGDELRADAVSGVVNARAVSAEAEEWYL
jgi:hypothetical protein